MSSRPPLILQCRISACTEIKKIYDHLGPYSNGTLGYGSGHQARPRAPLLEGMVVIGLDYEAEGREDEFEGMSEEDMSAHFGYPRDRISAAVVRGRRTGRLAL